MLKQASILSFTETNQRRTDAEMHTPYRQKHRETKLVWSTKNTSSKSRMDEKYGDREQVHGIDDKTSQRLGRSHKS